MSADLKKQSHKEFSSWSKSYDRSLLQMLLFDPSHKRIVRLLSRENSSGNMRILDVGCGTGKLAHRLVSACDRTHVTGIDLCEPMLHVARQRAANEPRISLCAGDSEHLPFADSSFDYVTCCNSFHHYPNQPAAVREMQRVLKPGGKLFLIDGYRDLPNGYLIYDLIVTRLEGGQVSHASAAEFRRLFDQAGFADIRQQVVHFPAPFILTCGQAVKQPAREHKDSAAVVATAGAAGGAEGTR